MSGSCKLLKESLAGEIVRVLEEKGVVVVPVPLALQKDNDLLAQKACQQYAQKDYKENIILLDTGQAKLMTTHYPLELLRQISGFENACFADPYAGGIGNSLRFIGMLPRDNTLKVEGLDNVFCCGEKAGLLVGHTEGIVTGTLAGHNAARVALGLTPRELPVTLACGDAIAFVRENMQREDGLMKKYTFSGSIYFEYLKSKDMYITDVTEIRQRVAEAGCSGLFANGRSKDKLGPH